MDQYDELYVISDIHLGGEKTVSSNFQIFKRGKRLANFIQTITATRPSEKVCLVLNGDIFDSLAEKDVEGYVAANKTEALQMMERIYKDDSFTSVWQALKDFLIAPKRYLVFVIGNHDIELALPIVQNFLKDTLASGEAERQTRMKFATTGGGYSCMVGKAQVYCTHGNEMDDFNWVDYNFLGQLANAMNADRSIDRNDLRPNAGTRIVVDVMNIVKERYPFVDVLKPEASAIAAILLTLDKETFSRIDIRDGIPILRDKWRGHSVTNNLLSDFDGNDSDQSHPQMMAAYLSHVVGANLNQEFISSSISLGEDDLLQDAEDHVEVPDSEYEETDGDEQETLGWMDVILGKVGFTSKKKALRHALQDWNEQQEDFKIDHKDALYFKIQDRIGSGIDFVITGHTHMPRALPMQHHGYYYNTGTWIRTFRFTQACLNDEVHFENVIWPQLKGGTLEELDNLDILADESGDSRTQKLLFDRSNAVRISANGKTTSGDLLRIVDDKGTANVKLELEPGSKTFIK